MKTKTLITIIYGLAIAGMAVWLLIEHKAGVQIHQENTELLRRLSEAMEKLGENQQRSGQAVTGIEAVSDANGAPLAAYSAAGGAEIQKLRGEIGKLLELHQQAESLRDDSRQAVAALENRRKEDRAARQAASGSVSALQILKAEYWTDHTRMDVTGELQDRVRGDNLKAVASNNLKGDPEFGQTKHLTVEYSIGGVTRTNEFRENEIVVLPAQ